MEAAKKVYIGRENEEVEENYTNLADASMEGVFLLGYCEGLKEGEWEQRRSYEYI